MDSTRDRSWWRVAVSIAAALTAIAMGTAAPAAMAEPVDPPAAGPTYEVDSAPASKMSLEFPWRSASISGPGALVFVKCTGSFSGTCVGTLTLKAPGGYHEVAYSIPGGGRQIVVVPLGSRQDRSDGIESPTARVVAQTRQSSGSSVRTTRLLRIK